MTTKSKEEQEEQTVTILRSEYDELKQDQRLLYALQGAGVDNWEGYDFAMEDMRWDDD